MGCAALEGGGTRDRGKPDDFGVDDPILDSFEISGPGSTPAHFGIIRGTVGKTGGEFEFSMEMAVPVPNEPLLPQIQQLWWLWALNTDPTTFPAGFPRVPGISTAPEFSVVVAWDGVRITAFVIDRRPLLTGGYAVITPIRFSIQGTEVSAFVDAAAHGNRRASAPGS